MKNKNPQHIENSSNHEKNSAPSTPRTPNNSKSHDSVKSTTKQQPSNEPATKVSLAMHRLKNQDNLPPDHEIVTQNQRANKPKR